VSAGRDRLRGARVVVTAGGTREPIDPVRYLGNRSSGKMGNALACAAAECGARVTLVTTAAAPEDHRINVVHVETADAMLAVLRMHISGAEVLLMAAAVADYRPEQVAAGKLKKRNEPWELRLVPTVDVLHTLRDLPERNGVFVVGFAAETDEMVSSAQRKLHDKGMDLIAVNDVSRGDIGMGADHNELTVLDAAGLVEVIRRAPKAEVAARLLEIVASRLP